MHKEVEDSRKDSVLASCAYDLAEPRGPISNSPRVRGVCV